MKPPKGTSLRQTTSFEPSTTKIGPAVWAGGDYKNIKMDTYIHTYIKKCTFSLYFTLTWGAHGLTDLNQIRHTYRSRRRNQFCPFSSRSDQGFLCGEGAKIGLSPLPANTPLPLCIALPCMQVITIIMRTHTNFEVNILAY